MGVEHGEGLIKKGVGKLRGSDRKVRGENLEGVIEKWEWNNEGNIEWGEKEYG